MSSSDEDINLTPAEYLCKREGTNIQVMDHLGRNALHLAVCSGYRKVVELLLVTGVEPNVKDNLGMTPLCLCLMRRIDKLVWTPNTSTFNIDSPLVLIRSQPPFNCILDDLYGASDAAIVATYCAQTYITHVNSPSLLMAQLLLDHGALLVTRLSPVDTGLFLQFIMMCIPTKEEENILRLLVRHGGLVNDPEAPGGRQGLHFAAMSNNTYLINILVDLGADLFDINHRNETPKQVAATFHCKEAYALLEHLEEVCVVDDT